MFATALTTVSSFQVVGLRKNDIALFRAIKIFGIEFFPAEIISIVHKCKFGFFRPNGQCNFAVMQWPDKIVPLQPVSDSFLDDRGIELAILREDLSHPDVSGNKWRKLKYNLIESHDRGIRTLVTTGGPHSNHIAATAAAGEMFGFKTIGIIRGYPANSKNPTLRFAREKGMELIFLDKATYRNFETDLLPRLHKKVGNYSFIPMGGSNLNGVRGCTEIPAEIPFVPDHIAVACGTGATMAGIVAGAEKGTQVTGFPVMKGGAYLINEVKQYIDDYCLKYPCAIKASYTLNANYHFGGFARMDHRLATFINKFKLRTGIALDGVYTGKMMFGVYDLIRKGFIAAGSKVVAIHTGGLQGNAGLNERYGFRLPLE